MDLMSHMSGTFIGHCTMMICKSCKQLFPPQVKADFLEAELIPAVTECTPKVILQDFIQLF